MSVKNRKITRNILSAMKGERRTTTAYDTQATVTRIEGGTAWIHIPGGVDETPASLTIDAQAGDTVQVRVSGGRAFLVGNQSAPPTDDATAIEARLKASIANTLASVAKTKAQNAETAALGAKIAASKAEAKAAVAEETANDARKVAVNYISADTTGMMVADMEDGEQTPSTATGKNVLIDNDSVEIRDGQTVLASFEDDTINLGANSDDSEILMSKGRARIAAEKYKDQYDQEFQGIFIDPTEKALEDYENVSIGFTCKRSSEEETSSGKTETTINAFDILAAGENINYKYEGTSNAVETYDSSGTWTGHERFYSDRMSNSQGAGYFTIGAGVELGTDETAVVAEARIDLQAAKNTEGNAETAINLQANSIEVNGTALIDLIYPVGAIYLSTTPVNPGYVLGGTWEQIKDRFLLTAGSTYTAGKTGGSATVTLASGNLPAHTHSIPALSGTAASAGAHTHSMNKWWSSGSGSSSAYTQSSSRTLTTKNTASAGAHTHKVTTTASTSGSTGSGTAFSILPPYLVVYAFKRTA